MGCILSKFYIKPQPYKNYYANKQGCILSKFYIKPQLSYRWPARRSVVSYRNSTSNHNYCRLGLGWLRVVSYRNSTSNHNGRTHNSNRTSVVSYRNSTSNHNWISPSLITDSVVSYRNSTSNHNLRVSGWWFPALYLIEILHQTTTASRQRLTSSLLYLIEILHQTTTQTRTVLQTKSCILSKFYIKPQLFGRHFSSHDVVSYRNSTSNHNSPEYTNFLNHVVSYRNSTSNHN